LRIWDWAREKEVLSFDVATRNAAMAFAPDGKSIATVSGNVVKRWNPATGAELGATGPVQDDPFSRGGGDLYSRMPYAPDSKTLAITVRSNHHVILIDADTGKVIGKLTNEKISKEQGMIIRSAVFSKDGARLYGGFVQAAAGPKLSQGLGGTLLEWDIK